MAIRGNLITAYVLLFTAVISVTTIAISDPTDLVNELVNLQSQSKSGIIHLDDHSVSRYLTSSKTPRPYYLLIFFDAIQLHEKTELHLQDLKREFSLLAASYIANNPENPNPNIFFCEIEFKQSQQSFGLFGVNSLPHIRLVAPTVKNLKDSEQMEQADFARMAEAMADFVQSRTKLTVGPIHRPPILSKNQIALVIVVVLIWIPFFIKKVINGGTLLHDWKIWLAGSLFVYFFSVSGAMHNIIRKMPMFLVDRNDPNRLVFFYQGSGMQLGAEGFAVGFLYTIVGLLLAFVTHVIVRVRNATVQRLVMVVAMLVSFWAVSKVIYLDNWKTGYSIHAFRPSGWCILDGVYEQGVSVLLKSFNKQRMKENLEVFDWRLSQEDLGKISSEIPQCKGWPALQLISDHGPDKSLQDIWDEDINLLP